MHLPVRHLQEGAEQVCPPDQCMQRACIQLSYGLRRIMGKYCKRNPYIKYKAHHFFRRINGVWTCDYCQETTDVKQAQAEAAPDRLVAGTLCQDGAGA